MTSKEQMVEDCLIYLKSLGIEKDEVIKPYTLIQEWYCDKITIRDIHDELTLAGVSGEDAYLYITIHESLELHRKHGVIGSIDEQLWSALSYIANVVLDGYSSLEWSSHKYAHRKNVEDAK